VAVTTKALLPLRPTVPDTSPRRELLSHLDAGSIGCLHARLAGATEIQVFVMLGEILAAHASDDRARLLRLLQNTGAVESGRLEALRAAAREGHSITEELFELVPEETVQELLGERFRENLFRFLQTSLAPRFEELDSVFVENIQVGHESRRLVEEFDELVQSTARLRSPPGLVLAPGGGTMKAAEHRRIAALCSRRLPIGELLERSPWEGGRTLAIVGEMLERGLLVPVSGREVEGNTDKPMPRPVQPARVGVDTGRPDPLARDFRRPASRPPEAGTDSPRDAVATALASAVSAAVAKVGRSRESSEPTAAPPRPPPPNTPASRASAVDAISAPSARPPARPAAVAAPPPPPPEPSRAALHPSALASFGADQPTKENDDELAAFQDYDHDRQGGEFTTATEHLDRVEVVSVDEVPAPRKARAAAAPPPVDGNPITIEMEDAENATHSELAGAVALNFAGPKLGEDDARRKVEVVNEVLAQLVIGLDGAKGRGVGQARAQLVIEGTPGAFSALFKGAEVDAQGRLPVEVVLKNLRKRPASEHRRLLNRGMQDVIDRAFSVASDELAETELEKLLEAVAGYQQRLGM
jgi:hypothetical protein